MTIPRTFTFLIEKVRRPMAGWRSGASPILVALMAVGLCVATDRPPATAQDGSEKEPLCSNEKIWMDHPVDPRKDKNWEQQVFLLGNAYFGVGSNGDPAKEVLTMAEKTFWIGAGGGENYDFSIIPVKDQSKIEQVKTLTAEGKWSEVDIIRKEILVSDQKKFGGFSYVGTLDLEFPGHDKEVTNYTRTLNLRDSRMDISYQIGDTTYTREYFCSYPDRVLAVRLRSSKPGKLNLHVAMNPAQKKLPPTFHLDAATGRYVVDGFVNGRLVKSPYRVSILVQSTDGTLSAEASKLSVKNSSEVVLYYTVATDYVMKPPFYSGADPVAITNAIIDTAKKTGFDTLYSRHVKDYQNLYHRTDLHLKNGVDPARVALPTDKRLAFYKQKEADFTDLGVKELAFNFGKYILISASRPGAHVGGLSGPWNNTMFGECGGFIQFDMNVTQNHMYGNALNLPECQEPFIALVKEQSEVGKAFARNYFNCDGWTSLMYTNLWSGAGFGNKLEWKFISTGWLALIAWEQYAFEQKESYLKEIYPVLKGASQFYLANLVDFKKSGLLVFAGNGSAEHDTVLGNSVSNYQDLTFLRETFQNTIRASEILKVDAEFRAKLVKTQSQLMPYKVGKWGQLMEWVEDLDDPNCKHRHMSHLLSLQPFSQINPRTMPALADAARVSIEHRGDDDNDAFFGRNGNSKDFPCQNPVIGQPRDPLTGQVWSRAARISTWLRLYNGDRADRIYNKILRESTLDNMIQYERCGTVRTPFFLDGMILSAGYVTEMMVQSQFGEIDLLPALPSAWSAEGSLKGIRARGGFTVDVEWKNGKVKTYRIVSETPKTVKVRLDNVVRSVDVSAKTAEGYVYQYDASSMFKF